MEELCCGPGRKRLSRCHSVTCAIVTLVTWSSHFPPRHATMSLACTAVSRREDHPTRLLDDDCVFEICSYAVDDVLSDETPSYATYTQLMPHFPRRWRVRRENHRTILAFALACKKHLNPALDVLWRELDGLARLLNILPSFRKTASMVRGLSRARGCTDYLTDW